VSETQRLVLIGLPGAGKSTVGPILAEMLAWSFLDLDRAIESEVGLTVAEIFAHHGESRFRQLEADLTKRLASQHQVVIAPGGGWITNPELRPVWRDALLIWLRVRPETALMRIRATGVTRPLLQVPDALAHLQWLLEQRQAFYEQAHVAFDTDDLDPREIADMIYKWLKKTN
jgi:shikimate kinase